MCHICPIRKDLACSCDFHISIETINIWKERKVGHNLVRVLKCNLVCATYSVRCTYIRGTMLPPYVSSYCLPECDLVIPRDSGLTVISGVSPEHRATQL